MILNFNSVTRQRLLSKSSHVRHQGLLPRIQGRGGLPPHRLDRRVYQGREELHHKEACRHEGHQLRHRDAHCYRKPEFTTIIERLRPDAIASY
mmetsp:Transcript_26147/g.43736  ORF Transcript_26147/g.43736 Transcript_26147/m.43736 type:complete len:93 (+) Transcript_26147:97-375(+)